MDVLLSNEEGDFFRSRKPEPYSKYEREVTGCALS